VLTRDKTLSLAFIIKQEAQFDAKTHSAVYYLEMLNLMHETQISSQVLMYANYTTPDSIT